VLSVEAEALVLVPPCLTLVLAPPDSKLGVRHADVEAEALGLEALVLVLTFVLGVEAEALVLAPPCLALEVSAGGRAPPRVRAS